MLAILLFCSIGLTFAKTNYFNLPEEQWTKPETPEVGFLGLSSGASLVVPNIRTDFTCVGKSYGYYADVANNCQIFHVCQPSTTAKGEAVIYHFAKFCPNQTQFDQKLLNCQSLDYPNLLPCEQSVQYYPLTEARFAGSQFEGQQKETIVEQTPEIEQTIEQTQVEEEVPEVAPVIANPVPPPVKGSQPIPTPVAVVTPLSTKNVVRSESVEVVQQPIPVAQPQNGFVETSQPLRRVPLIQTVSQSVAPVIPSRNVPLIPVSEPQVVAQPGLVGPAVSLRNGRLTQTTPNQPVVTLRRSSVFQPVLSQSNIALRSVPQPTVPVNQVPIPVVPQPIVPFRSSQILENISNQGVVSQPLLSRYNVLPSQLVGVQSPQVVSQVVPQVYRTQSVVSHYSVPRVSVTPVVTQNFVPQPVVSQPVLSQYTVPLNGVFSSQNIVSQPVVPAVPNLLRYNQPYVNVVRPAQNPEYINQ